MGKNEPSWRFSTLWGLVGFRGLWRRMETGEVSEKSYSYGTLVEFFEIKLTVALDFLNFD